MRPGRYRCAARPFVPADAPVASRLAPLGEPRDGGLSSPPPHRFVNILCPYIKIDVTFQGEQELRPFAEIPADAAIAAVSRPYFEQPYMD